MHAPDNFCNVLICNYPGKDVRVCGCRVEQSVVDDSGTMHAFTLAPEQLRVTSKESFWAAVELTADSGVLSAPDLASYSEAQAYEHAYPPTRHDPFLPEPTAIGGGALHVENR
jgi:hypothetical protein